MIFKIKEYEVDVIFNLDKKRRGWQIKYIEGNKFLFKSNKHMTNDEIFLEMQKHYRFIKRCLNVVSSNRFDKFIHVFGNEYELIIKDSDVNKLIVIDDKAYLYTRNKDYDYNKKIVASFYEEILSNYINSKIDEAKRKCKINFDIKIEYKQVKSYYGECFTKEKKIIFQKNLAKYEKKYILSVIYHELAHFYYKNHGTNFYNFLEIVFPNYELTQRMLRKTKYNDTY